MRKVFVEGKTDFAFVRALGISRKNARALGSKGDVCNYFAKHREVVGLLDEDPDETPSKYLRNLEKEKEELQHDLLLYEDSKNTNKIIALRPRLEEWLIKVCKDAGLKMNDPNDPKYELKLPNKPKELHDFLPQHPEQLGTLVTHLLELKNPALLLLQSHLLEK